MRRTIETCRRRTVRSFAKNQGPSVSFEAPVCRSRCEDPQSPHSCHQSAVADMTACHLWTPPGTQAVFVGCCHLSGLLMQPRGCGPVWEVADGNHHARSLLEGTVESPGSSDPVSPTVVPYPPTTDLASRRPPTTIPALCPNRSWSSVSSALRQKSPDDRRIQSAACLLSYQRTYESIAFECLLAARAAFEHFAGRVLTQRVNSFVRRYHCWRAPPSPAYGACVPASARATSLSPLPAERPS